MVIERQIVMGLDEANVVRILAKVITTGAERKIPVAATHSTAAWTATFLMNLFSVPKLMPGFLLKALPEGSVRN